MQLLHQATLERRLRNRYEAGAYVPRSAAAGLPVSVASDGSRWVSNPSMGGEWQRIHVMVSSSPGNNLWGISGIYYGGASYAGMMKIYNVPQNKKIQGSDPNKGLYPGDEILIPGLAAPAGVGGSPAPAGVPELPGLGGLGGLALPSSAPPGWPEGVPWPGSTSPSSPPAEQPAASLPLPLPTPPTLDTPPALPGVPGLIPASTTPASTTPAKPEEKFWTTGKIAAAAGGGVVVLGTILYLALRKPSRRRR